MTLGFDGRVVSARMAERLRAIAEKNGDHLLRTVMFISVIVPYLNNLAVNIRVGDNRNNRL